MQTKQYYLVTYYSPGTFFSEVSSYKFDEFSLKQFVQKSKQITERYNAKPYGFSVEKYEVIVDLPDGFECKPKLLEKAGGTYYINGKAVFSKDLDKQKEDIFISNLERNSQGVGIVSTNSYRFNSFFYEWDFVINDLGEITQKGNDKDIMEYRKLFS